MAQVTMTGMEYIEMLEVQKRLQEVMELMKADRHVHFNLDDGPTASFGIFPERRTWPDWLLQEVLEDVVSWMLQLPDEEFLCWVRGGRRFYDPYDNSLSQYSWSRSADLWEHPRLKDRVAEAQAQVQREDDEEAMQDA